MGKDDRSKAMKLVPTIFCCGLLVILSSIGARAQSIQTDYDRSFNLAKLRTYRFIEQTRPPGDPLAASPLNDRRIHMALDSQLQAQGFRPSEQPDFYVTYHVATRMGLDIEDNRISGPPWDRWGNIKVNQVTEGTLMVMFLDPASRQEIWIGLVSGEINPKNLDRDVNKSIAKMVQRFVKDQAAKK
jgi:Domain of unknown function (DUF4136)